MRHPSDGPNGPCLRREYLGKEEAGVVRPPFCCVLATGEHGKTQEHAFDQRHGGGGLACGAQLQVGVGEDRERLFQFGSPPALGLTQHAVAAWAKDGWAHAGDAGCCAAGVRGSGVERAEVAGGTDAERHRVCALGLQFAQDGPEFRGATFGDDVENVIQLGFGRGWRAVDDVLLLYL